MSQRVLHRMGCTLLPLSNQICINKHRCLYTRHSTFKILPHRTSQHLKYSTLYDQQNRPPDETVINRLKRIERTLKVRGYSILRIGAGLVLCVGVGVYWFRDHLRHNVAEEVSSVASRSLEHEAVKMKAEELSKALLQALMNDESIKSEAARFIGEIIKAPHTQTMVVQLLVNLMNDPYTQRKLTAAMKQLVSRSLSDPTFRHNLAINLKELFNDPITRAGMASLVQYILTDDSVKEEAKIFVQNVLASKQVTQETTRLGKETLQGVIQDESIQKRTGDAMWSAFGYSLRPSWFSGSSNRNPVSPDKDIEPPE